MNLRIGKRIDAHRRVGALCAFLLVYLLGVTVAHGDTAEGLEVDDILFGFIRTDTYDSYLREYEGAARPLTEIRIPARSFAEADGVDLEVLDEWHGRGAVVRWPSDEGRVSWRVEVDEPGFYQLGLEYYPLPSKNTVLEMQVRIDGEIPFQAARRLTLNKLWIDEQGILTDPRGNEMRSKKVEVPRWTFEEFGDEEGKVDDPFSFYFGEGTHTVSMHVMKGVFVLDELVLRNTPEPPSYAQVRSDYEERGYTETSGHRIIVQAEHPTIRSDAIVHPQSDASGPGTQPNHPTKIRLNTIGGQNWQYPLQWVTWEFEVPETGLYKLGIRAMQSFRQGLFVTRSITIDGETPFAELETVEFPFRRTWFMKTLGEDRDEDGRVEPFLFHLTKGTHTITMKTVSGDLAQTIRVVQDAVYRLNYAYRRILMITGSNPDPYRDYYLNKEIPGLMENFRQVKQLLQEEQNRIESITGLKGGVSASMERVVVILESFEERPNTIARRLQTFQSAVGALSGTMLNLKSQPLQIDYLVVASPDQRFPRARAGFISRQWFKLRRFLGSFTEDYSSVGEVYDNAEAVEVWSLRGRDQATIIKQLVDNDFVRRTGIPVNVKLVGQAMTGQGRMQPGRNPLIQAVLANKAPDVALFIPHNEPVNLAARGGLVKLSDFEDYEEVASRFQPSALESYRWQGDEYALPITMNFPMMFYRKDIFDELEIEAPDTWEEFYDVIPVIQRYNMRIGLPALTVQVSAAGQAVNTIFQMLLYQHGGDYFTPDKSRSALDTPEAFAAFKQWTSFYTQYGFPIQYSFYNEFRTGEMPLAIENYNQYQQLVVGAPEIRGQWEMRPVPGIRQPDGSIRNVTTPSGDAAVIFKQAEDHDAAWEFIKWWLSTDVQTEFGRTIESIIGPAARYTPANVQTVGYLPWSRNEYELIMSQIWNTVGFPVIPASYYVFRNITYAFRNVTYHWENPREVWFENNRETNLEIIRKRIEFGLESQDALDRLR